ncbi:MAG: Fe-S cluster assembly sulfur transfer protein SufU [Acidobacteriota bacterium]
MTDRPEAALDELYREVVMDHHRHPRGRDPLPRVDSRAHGFNPMCGDELFLNLAIDGDRVTGVQVEGRGCAISTASSSILAEMLPGRTVAEAEATATAFRALMHGEARPDDTDLGDLEALEGVRKFAVRVKCAMLAWVTLQDALAAWRQGDRHSQSSTEGEEPQ